MQHQIRGSSCNSSPLSPTRPYSLLPIDVHAYRSPSAILSCAQQAQRERQECEAEERSIQLQERDDEARSYSINDSVSMQVYRRGHQAQIARVCNSCLLCLMPDRLLAGWCCPSLPSLCETVCDILSASLCQFIYFWSSVPSLTYM